MGKTNGHVTDDVT